jgi:hypothetical protein
VEPGRSKPASPLHVPRHQTMSRLACRARTRLITSVRIMTD